jgi:hypothetical protein
MYINPYACASTSKGNWLRSNFHTHAGTGKGTCGVNTIEDVVASYKEAGYEVLMISNHDLLTDTSEYAYKYGILTINGYEFSKEWRHMLCIGVQGTAVLGEPEDAIENCKNQNGLAVICHPNWIQKEYWPWSILNSMKGYTGIEIFNSVIFRLGGSGLATDTWDYLLSQGKLVWGFGNDDFHRWFDLAKSWNMIYAEDRTEASVMEAIRRGSFYVSTGLILNEISFEAGKIRVSASSLNTYVNDNKYIFIGRDGEKLKEQSGVFGEYEQSGDEMYVRVQVVSEHGAMLWTQPIYKESFMAGV